MAALTWNNESVQSGDSSNSLQARGEPLEQKPLRDGNTVHDLQNYVVGPAPNGGFQTINYFPLLAGLTVRNNVQPRVGAHPVDFISLRLPEAPPDEERVWLYGDESHQAIILSQHQNGDFNFRYQPARGLRQDSDGSIHFDPAPLDIGFPLRLWEDQDLRVPAEQRAVWLSAWHTELEWLHAVHKTRYSNGILALHEQFLRDSQSQDLPGDTGLVARFSARRRQLAEPDFLVFANDPWNFNVRGFNPGGNHGSLLRISTHSVLMLAGGDETGVPRGLVIDEPYDSLSFVPTILNLMGHHQEASQLPGRTIHELLPQAKSSGF